MIPVKKHRSTMLVQALCLRRAGVKLSPAELRAARPLVGKLHFLANQYQGRDGRGRQVCHLMPVTGALPPIVELFDAKVVKIEDRGVLIAGTEEHWNRKLRKTFPQAIWAWPFHPSAQVLLSPPARDAAPRDERLTELLEALEAIG